MLTLDAFGGYHNYKIESPEKDYKVNAYMGGAGFWVKPGDAYLRGIGYYARNARQFGQYLGSQPASFASARIADDDVLVNDAYAGAIFTGYRINDRLKGEIGYGYIQSKDDSCGAETEKWQSYYAQLVVTLTRGVTVTPEFGINENRDTKERLAYFGAKWQANF